MHHALGYSGLDQTATEVESTDDTYETFSFDIREMNPFSGNPFDKVKELGSNIGSKISSNLPIGNKPGEEGQGETAVAADAQAQPMPTAEDPAMAGQPAAGGSFFDKMSNAMNPVKDLGSKVGGLFGQKGEEAVSPTQQQAPVPGDISDAAGGEYQQQQQQQAGMEGQAPVGEEQAEVGGLDKIKNIGAGIFSSGKQFGGSVFESTSSAFSSIKSTVEDKMGKGGNKE